MYFFKLFIIALVGGLKFRYYNLQKVNNKGADQTAQTAQMLRLVLPHSCLLATK